MRAAAMMLLWVSSALWILLHDKPCERYARQPCSRLPSRAGNSINAKIDLRQRSTESEVSMACGTRFGARCGGLWLHHVSARGSLQKHRGHDEAARRTELSRTGDRRA